MTPTHIKSANLFEDLYDYTELDLNMDKASDLKKKSTPCMLVVFFRVYVKSQWCQSHVGDMSIFLEGQAVSVNPPAPIEDASLCLEIRSHLGGFSNTLYSQHGLSLFL